VVLSGLPGTGPVGYHHTEVCAAGTESIFSQTHKMEPIWPLLQTYILEKAISFRAALPPWPPTRGSGPWTPAIGSSSPWEPKPPFHKSCLQPWS